MVWQRAGTVSVQNGSNTVIGTNVDFAASSRNGDSFIGPDGASYELANVASATVISILPAYKGPTVSGAAYAIMPVQGYDKMLSDAFNALNNQFGPKLAALGTTGNYEILPVAKGGTGGDTAASARAGLGLYEILPVAKGGTGGDTAVAARTGLGLGTSATATIGTAAGNVMQVGAFGLGGQSRNVTTNPDSSPVGGGFNYYTDASGGSSQANNRFGIRFSIGSGTNQGFELLNDPWSPKLYFRYSSSSAGAPWFAPLEIYHTGNTTRGSGGSLSAASPILRIACVATSERRDLQEQTFEPAGEWGVVNSEARGVAVERIGVGEYKVTGSLGLALEGWRTQDPCSPDGGRTLGVTDSRQDTDGTVVISLFKQRWTLSDDGEMVPGRGAPMDVPPNSWIDVRLEMPKTDEPPPALPLEE